MVFYDFKVEYQVKKTTMKSDNGRERSFSNFALGINEQLGVECGLDGNISMVITGGEFGRLQLVVACKLEMVTLKECKIYICKILREVLEVLDDIKIVEEREISVKDVHAIVKRADNSGTLGGTSWFLRELKIDYFNSCNFRIKEKCYVKELTYEEAVEKAEKIMADSSLLNEIKRIYSKENIKKYYGNPVHYVLTVGTNEAAIEMIDILVPALKTNNRLLGGRVNYIYSIEEYCYDEEDMKNLFEIAKGNVVVIEMRGSDGMHGNYASTYERVVEFFNNLIESYGFNTLCFFVNNTEHSGFAKSMIAKAKGGIDIIEIQEGMGNYERAMQYFKQLTETTDFPLQMDEVKEILPKKSLFTISEVQKVYKKWYGNGLKNRVYKAYKTVELVEVEDKQKVSNPYKELQNMIGLSEIKQVVNQIIAAGRMQKLRSEMGLDSYKTSMHMIFTGNPGSAKTTVARLLAQILRRENILDSGSFVEVGRADLIAQYVGWTAKTVCAKFREAQGGILFIDEAYSLVDDSNSFGDEAINTIVQEMENNRDDVIVIFAGYPKKMELFMQKNEGLRSRIAFHLNFPDYKADEMLSILELMCKQKGYIMNVGTREKCMDIFRNACSHEEFGNGRFVRNLLEQAMMRQSQRLFEECKGKKISKKQLSLLMVDDFDTNVCEQYKKEEKKRIGFTN